MQNIVDETTVLQVGKYYNVRCAELVDGEKVIDYVPVIGEPHKDPQFGVNYAHYHIDGRFNNKEYILDENGKTNSILPLKKPLSWSYHVAKIVIKRRQCLRLTTGILPPTKRENRYFVSQTNIAYYTWYNNYIGKSCKGKKCPHLGTQMQEHNGVLVCPLHDLTACKKTELIIPHPLDK